MLISPNLFAYSYKSKSRKLKRSIFILDNICNLFYWKKRNLDRFVRHIFKSNLAGIPYRRIIILSIKTSIVHNNYFVINIFGIRVFIINIFFQNDKTKVFFL